MLNLANLRIFSTGNTPKDLNIFVGKERLEGVKSLEFKKITPEQKEIEVAIQVNLYSEKIKTLGNMKMIEPENTFGKAAFTVGKEILYGVISYEIDKENEEHGLITATIKAKIQKISK